MVRPHSFSDLLSCCLATPNLCSSYRSGLWFLQSLLPLAPVSAQPVPLASCAHYPPAVLFWLLCPWGDFVTPRGPHPSYRPLWLQYVCLTVLYLANSNSLWNEGMSFLSWGTVHPSFFQLSRFHTLQGPAPRPCALGAILGSLSSWWQYLSPLPRISPPVCPLGI